MEGFELKHGSATQEKALVAADNVEKSVGEFLRGNKKALLSIDVEDFALLVQFARNQKQVKLENNGLPRRPISRMTEQQSHDISNAMVDAIENRDPTKPWVFIKA